MRLSGCIPGPLKPPHNPCGSGLAREYGVSVNSSLAGLTPSRASPLPQLIQGAGQIADTKKPQWAKPMQFWLKRSIVR
ncbi:hypothetical protein C2E19_10740 [Pseudomonas sp. DTU12.3]|nr:hypothetical protein C2E19_10740 [Pseudomonas sp. DTU12.3]